MIVIGLTGGIASGKTTVSKIFENLGVKVISVDKINNELLEQKEIKDNIVKYFGKQVIHNDSLNKKKIANLIFTNKEDKKWLENLLHPIIKNCLKKKISEIKDSYCIVEIPILFEVNFLDVVDKILVVDLPEEKQIERAMKRDNKTKEEIKAVIDNQISRDYRNKNADDIINTENSLKIVEKQIELLNCKYLKL